MTEVRPDREQGGAAVVEREADRGGDDRPADAATGAGRGPVARPDRRRAVLVVAGLVAVLVVPLVVALVALRSPRWYPLLDLAQTELRVRDVGTRHSPLIGLIGRISAYGHDGSHPGPLSFWALAPVYRLLGSTSWGLMVSTVTLSVTAMALTLWIAFRRGGTPLALGFAAVMAVLLHVYGTPVLTEPWNPYLPVMWWLLTLTAVWAVACDDLPMLPVAVFAGSFCMQTHVSYLGLVGGFVGLGAAALIARAVVVRRDRAALRRLAVWTAGAAALGVVLWLPPLIDQLTHDPGNAAIVIHHFGSPGSQPIGLERGGELFAVHLNLWRFLSGQGATSGSVLPALGLVAVWLAAAVWTWRAGDHGDGDRPRALLRLHGVVAVALLLGLVSASRILGEVWFYLTLWAWGTTALMLVAMAWTGVLALRAARGRTPPGERQLRRLAPAGLAALGAVLVVWTALFTADATDAEVPAARQSLIVSRLAPDTLAALEAGELPGTGPDGRYLVTWNDPGGLGAPGWGLLDELERRGFDVGVIDFHRVGATPHRVRPQEEATAQVHVALGADIDLWRARDDVEQVAYVDPRSDAERAEYARLRREVIGRFRGLGMNEQAEEVDTALFALYLDQQVPPDVRRKLVRLGELGLPAAVFVTPLPAAAGA